MRRDVIRLLLATPPSLGVVFRPFQCALLGSELLEQLMSVFGLWQRWNLREFGRTEASQIVELAVSLPLLAVVVIGLTDFSGAFNLKFKLNSAVREGARFASTQSTADLSNPTPLSISGVRDVVDNYLTAVHVNDCGLSTTAPINAGLTWTYTANTGCPGTLTLTIDRGSVFVTGAGTPVTVEATHVSIQYPYQWRFNRVIGVLIPGATYLGVTLISTDAVVQNLN
jgi:Flp pilus assembly protein TadG